MKTKYIDNKSENLIVFLTGWGCDDNQFKFMKNSDFYDVLLCYDYDDLKLDFSFEKYKNCYLIAFSAGVFIAGILKNNLPKFKKSIAINGNPLAYDEYYGLRREIVDVFEGVTKENALSFRRKYLVYDEKEYNLFNKMQSLRSFESCKEELISLKKHAEINAKPFDFDVALISNNDKIFYPERQIEYWSNKSRVVIIENSAHFSFFKLDDYSKIVNS